MIDVQALEKVISEETRIEFEASTGDDVEGQRWYLLRPHGLLADHTFGIRTTIGWRRLYIRFESGKFAGSLLSDMGRVDEDGQSAFHAVLNDCHNRGAKIDLEINGTPFLFDSKEAWSPTWKRFELKMNIGQLNVGIDEGNQDSNTICHWTGRFTAAILAILPTVVIDDGFGPEVAGYPEGALTTVQTNRYERDRRNRAAAIAIHGRVCIGCGLEMSSRYGSVAAGFIEIHHATPVSQLCEGYVIDPEHDLVPLCPNCHAVVHRRTPPLTLEELKALLDKP